MEFISNNKFSIKDGRYSLVPDDYDVSNAVINVLAPEDYLKLKHLFEDPSVTDQRDAYNSCFGENIDVKELL